MGVRIGMVGTGGFAQSFIPLFIAHPLVDDVVLCDLHRDRAAAASQAFGIPTIRCA
ncbi:MAG: hypothetical protein M3442_04550 [Chloroflexota bacterium]|nr:hypothetical protein [Chloroflexota bacterium]